MENTRNRRLLTLKVRTKEILPFVILIALIILMGGNTRNPDIVNYIWSYNTTGYDVEGSYLYTLINDLFVRLGLSFEMFRLALYAVGLFNIRYACKKMGASSVIIYTCYGIALMMIDATQTYNFFGMSLLLVGVAHLITDESYNRTKYVIAILLASGFHMVFLFYIPFIFIYRRTDNKQLLKVYIFTTVIIFLLSTVAGVSGLAGIIQRILTLTGLNAYQSYLSARTRFGHYYPILVHLISCAYSFYFYKKTEKYDYGCKEICRIILLLNLYGIFAFPLFRFQLTLARLTRNLEMFTFISGVVFIKEQSNKTVRILITFALLVLAGVMGYVSVYSDYQETIVDPFWKFNWIIGRQ